MFKFLRKLWPWREAPVDLRSDWKEDYLCCRIQAEVFEMKRKTKLIVDRDSEAYKEIMAAAKGATPSNGINTRGMTDDEFLKLLFRKK